MAHIKIVPYTILCGPDKTLFLLKPVKVLSGHIQNWANIK